MYPDAGFERLVAAVKGDLLERHVGIGSRAAEPGPQAVSGEPAHQLGRLLLRFAAAVLEIAGHALDDAADAVGREPLGRDRVAIIDPAEDRVTGREVRALRPGLQRLAGLRYVGLRDHDADGTVLGCLGACEHDLHAQLRHADEADAGPELHPVEADEFRPPKRTAEADGDQAGIAQADVAARVEHGQRLAHVRGLEGRGLPVHLRHGLHPADAAPGRADEALLAVEGVAGRPLAVRDRRQGLRDGGACQRLAPVEAVGQGGEEGGHRRRRRRHGLAAVPVSPAFEDSDPPRIGGPGPGGQGFLGIRLGALDEIVG